uniref:Uncharacterized protein n=1 Tax=Amorphochlora amoebiformis TaxID=1561963 RepID=A0A7S0D5C4_9EUKA
MGSNNIRTAARTDTVLHAFTFSVHVQDVGFGANPPNTPDRPSDQFMVDPYSEVRQNHFGPNGLGYYLASSKFNGMPLEYTTRDDTVALMEECKDILLDIRIRDPEERVHKALLCKRRKWKPGIWDGCPPRLSDKEIINNSLQYVPIR